MRRLDQDQLKAALRSTAACLIGMEAPVGAHYLSRRRRLLGRDVPDCQTPALILRSTLTSAPPRRPAR
jgi:hypothetical protein